MFPRLRWAAAAWLLVWAPSYAWGYGLLNFLSLCDVAVILTCVGLWTGSALLLSSQALASIVVDSLRVLDVAGRLLTGRHPIGGTEYMWDAQFPLWLRLLSLFHVVWPPLLVYAVRRAGWHPRGLLLQVALTAAVLVLSRLLAPADLNLNYAWADPFLKRQWGPGPVHLAVMLGVMTLVVYAPTAAALRRIAGAPR